MHMPRQLNRQMHVQTQAEAAIWVQMPCALLICVICVCDLRGQPLTRCYEQLHGQCSDMLNTPRRELRALLLLWIIVFIGVCPPFDVHSYTEVPN